MTIRTHLTCAAALLLWCCQGATTYHEEDSRTDSSSPDVTDGTTDTGSPDVTEDTPETDGGHCGDGVLEEWRGEQCDDGEDNSDTEPDACRTDCTLPDCGDSVTDTGEECDDGNDVDNDECSNGCVVVLGDICTTCTTDEECGREMDLCVILDDGTYCAVDCTGEHGCPEGFTCETLESGVHQCIPSSGVCAPCHDPDGDGYGVGPECLGLDCDEENTEINVGAVEVCDGLDNDCNGMADDGDPGGGATCETGLPGVCAEGIVRCREAELRCIQQVPVSEEECDGLDNDCDGSADEGNPGGGAPCDTGLAGVCAAGTRTCEDGVLECVQNTSPHTEVCNGLDDDCDGPVDEGDPGGGAACNTGLDGVCATGEMHCRSGSPVCEQTVFPTSEDCADALDNDCDGRVNEDCCAHDICTTGDPLSATCDGCVALICSSDDYCCTTHWDGLCVDNVFEVCGSGECGAPDVWTCADRYYGTDDGCDCGCGMLDPDCADATVGSCEYCGLEGSCGTSSCPGNIHPTENWHCV